MKQTGMSAESLSSFGPAAESVAHAVREMQIKIVAGGDDTQKALAGLGLSLEDLKGKTPEQQLGLLADRLNTVSDSSEKTAISQALFGRGSAEIVGVLAKGSVGMNAMIANARQMGTLMGGETVQKAEGLNKAFGKLAQSADGFSNALGSAVAPLLSEILDKFTSLTQGATAWVSENEDVIKSAFQVGTAIGMAGAAFAALAGAIYAALSPAIMFAASIMVIGACLFAVLDVLGETDTGIGDAFNSIRIRGTGLATWMGAFWIFVKTGWSGLGDLISWVASGICDSFRYALAKVENFFLAIIQGIAKGIKWLIEGFNAVAPAAMKVSTAWADKIDQAAQARRDDNNGDIGIRSQHREEIEYQAKNAVKNNSLDMQQLFDKDPESGGTGIDTRKLKDAFKKAGGGAWDEIMGGFNLARAQLPDAPKPGAADTAFGQKGAGKAPGGSWLRWDRGTSTDAMMQPQSSKADVVGTFNASAAGQLGVGHSAQERMAAGIDKIARNTDPNASSVRAL